MVGKAQVAKRKICAHKLRSLVASVRIKIRVVLNVGPAEIIHASDFIEPAANGKDSPHSLIDCGRHHVIGIYLGIGGQKRLRDRKTGICVKLGPHYRRIVWNVPVPSRHELDGAAALNFMIVLALDPLPAVQIGSGKQRVQEPAVMRRLGQRRLNHAARAGRRPLGIEFPLGEVLRKKAEVQICASPVPINQAQLPRIFIPAYDSAFGLMFSAKVP